MNLTSAQYFSFGSKCFVFNPGVDMTGANVNLSVNDCLSHRLVIDDENYLIILSTTMKSSGQMTTK